MTPDIRLMVNEWMVAGLLSIIAVTTTLGALGPYVQDRETNRTLDFLTTPVRRATVQLSYSLSAFSIGMLLTLVGLVIGQVFLLVSGGTWLSPMQLIQVLGIIALSVLLSSVIGSFIVVFVQSQSAFGTLSTIVGTLIGFLCGVYIPLGELPGFVQNLIYLFPPSHTTVLMRQVLMEDTMAKVFPAPFATEAAESYSKTAGVHFEVGKLRRTQAGRISSGPLPRKGRTSYSNMCSA